MLNKGYYINSGIYNTDKWVYNINIEVPSITFKNKEGVDSPQTAIELYNKYNKVIK